MRFTTAHFRVYAAAFLAVISGGLAKIHAQEVQVSPLTVRWLGQSGEDRTGYSNLPMPNGVNDFVIAVDSSSMIHPSPVQWTLHADGALRGANDWAWPQTAAQVSAIAVERRGGEYQLFFEPFLAVPGDIVRVTVAFADGSSQTGLVVSDGVRWGATALWRGQSDSDFVGRAEGSNGCRDWLIEVSDDAFAANDVREWGVWQDFAGRDPYLTAHWVWRAGAPPQSADGRPIHPLGSGAAALLYFDPALAREGDQFVIRAVLESGEIIAWMLAGGGSDWGETAVYHGRVGEDKVGEWGTGANGVNDIVMELHDPALGGGIRRFKVSSNGRNWEWPIGNGTEADPDSKFAGVDTHSGSLRVSIDNADESAGAFYFASVVLNNGRMLGWAVATSRTNNSTEIEWLGQSADVLSPYDWTAQAATARLYPPDGDLDLAVKVSHPLLGISPVREWRVEGAGRAWGNPGDLPRSRHVAGSAPPAAGAAPFSPVAITDAGAGNAAPGASNEKIIYFAEPKEPVTKGAPFAVTAILTDGNVIVWRIASPGSPALTGVQWTGVERGKYVIRMDPVKGLVNSLRVRSENHTWSTVGTAGGSPDAAMSSTSKAVTLKLEADRATLRPGAQLPVELTDGLGVRHYGSVITGVVE